MLDVLHSCLQSLSFLDLECLCISLMFDVQSCLIVSYKVLTDLSKVVCRLRTTTTSTEAAHTEHGDPMEVYGRSCDVKVKQYKIENSEI